MFTSFCDDLFRITGAKLYNSWPSFIEDTAKTNFGLFTDHSSEYEYSKQLPRAILANDEANFTILTKFTAKQIYWSRSPRKNQPTLANASQTDLVN